MEIEFSNLIKNGKIPDLAEKFHRIIGIPIAIHDTDGKILCSFGKPDICETFYGLTPETKKICEDTSRLLEKKLGHEKKFTLHKFKNNLCIAASPITVAGKHLANLHAGSFFLKKPDLFFFEKQAAALGFEKDSYLHAVKNTPVITENRLEDIMSFLTSLSELIGAMWKNEFERQSTVKRLIESESKYRELVENANSIILRKNAKGKITFFNEYAEKFFGFSKEEVLGKSTIETIVPETDSTGRDLRKMVRKIIELPEKFASNENENKCKDGRRVWVSWTNKAIVDEKGKLKEILCIGNDITSIKKAADEVATSKKFLENIFDSTLDGLIVCDSAGMIESINSATEKILGYKIEELKNKHLSAITPPESDHYHTAVKTMKKLLENGSINNFETVWVRKDGSPCPVEINSHLVRDSQGNILRAINSIRNISKRKKAEETASQLKEAIEQAAEIVTIIGNTGEIKYVNPALEKITGYPPEKLIGSNPFLKDTDKYNYSFYEEIWAAANKGQVWKGHLSPLKPDGTTCELDITISPIRDTSGKITSYVSISRDVSNVLKLENQLRQTQKMEAIGLLAGGIAHDFNNVLGAVIGFTEMAHYDAPKDSPIKYNLEQVLESCVRAKNLVKQILAFSRQSKEDRIPTYIHLIVKETIKLLRASLPSTIEIHHDIETQEDMLLADTTQIHQLIMNLCTNAAHSMRKKGGVLSLNLSSVLLDSSIVSVSPDLSPGDYIKLTISDTGTGIRPDIIDHIFEPFFTTKAVGEGTGMGLTAVKGTVKNHNGSITVNSKPGKGTTFHIFLPKTLEQIKAKEEEEEEALAPLPTGKEHILLVDDENLLVNVGKKMLTSLGYIVTAKADSNEALELLKQNPEAFDIVITDQTMPHLTGYDLSKKIIKIRPDIPIILCTGYSESISEKKAKSIGIREYMLKPLNRKDLAETVRRILDGKKQ